MESRIQRQIQNRRRRQGQRQRPRQIISLGREPQERNVNQTDKPWRGGTPELRRESQSARMSPLRGSTDGGLFL